MSGTVSEDVETILDALPDRDLRPEEAETVALSLGADGLSRVTYDTEDGERYVLSAFLWFEDAPVGHALSLARESGEWSLEALGRCDYPTFLDAVDAVREDHDVGPEGATGQIIEFDGQGNVRDRFERSL